MGGRGSIVASRTGAVRCGRGGFIASPSPPPSRDEARRSTRVGGGGCGAVTAVGVGVAGRWVGPFGVGLGLLARLAAVFPLPSRFSHIVFAFGHRAIPSRPVSVAARRNQSGGTSRPGRMVVCLTCP